MDGNMLLYSMLVLQACTNEQPVEQSKSTISKTEKEKTPAQTDAHSSGTQANKETNSETKDSSKEAMEGTPMALIKAINSAMLSGVSPYGKQNIKASKEHTINGWGHISDYNIYPAENAVILQGVVSGSIGEFTQFGGASICLTASKADLQDNSPSRLEMGVVFMVDDDEGTGDQYSVLPIPQLPNQETWALVGANSMTIEDVDKDQKNEIIINAQWLPEGKTKVVDERIVLKLTRGCAPNEYCDAMLTRVK